MYVYVAMSNVYDPDGYFKAVGDAFESDMKKAGVKIMETTAVHSLLSKIKEMNLTSIEE